MAKKYVIIHGHFYQPPRENPWIDSIETQSSAAPYHDWNERIYEECYRPNAYSRLLDRHGMIIDIHNNYGVMSFNFGPTLFSWIERRHDGTARRIVSADSASRRALDGHGNAIAQVFNHVIMPLATVRDQLTQIRWARQFFRKRFRREPEGMWLAETAINMETVKCLIAENIRFVVLSPSQAEATRPLDGNAQWTPAAGGFDTRHPYRIYPSDESGNRLSGSLDVFFFDSALSHEVSFGDLLTDAHLLGARIDAGFNGHDSEDQVVTIATDGETFGHHKPFGDMCLAYFFMKIAPKFGLQPVNFGYFLARNPPRREVRLKNAFGEGTAWSCAHGVGRWVRDCGCSTGGDPSWKQQWRTPLRTSLEELKERVDTRFEAVCSAAGVADAWELRDAYIQSTDDPSPGAFRALLERQISGTRISPETTDAIRAVCEAQKYLLFSFSSCGWFFSDIGGIEAMQNVAFALRALQLGADPAAAREIVLREFLDGLDSARSNLSGVTGKTLAQRDLVPFLEHEKIIAFTVSVERAVGGVRVDQVSFFRYDVRLRERCAFERDRLVYSGFDVSVENESTGERGRWAVLVSHRDCSEVRGWVVAADALGASPRDDLKPETWFLHPGVREYTLSHLFQTSRESLAGYFHRRILKDTYTKFSAWMRKNEQELDFLSRLDFPLPPYCKSSLAFVCNRRWNDCIGLLTRRGAEDEVFSKLRDVSALVERCKLSIDLKESAGMLERIITTELAALPIRMSVETCERIRTLLDIVDTFKIPLSKHTMEDIFYPLLSGPLRSLYDEVCSPDEAADTPASPGASAEKQAMLSTIIHFARRMNFNTDRFRVEERPKCPK